MTSFLSVYIPYFLTRRKDKNGCVIWSISIIRDKPTILRYLRLPRENGYFNSFILLLLLLSLPFSLLRFWCDWCLQLKLIRPHASFYIVGFNSGCVVFYLCHSPRWWILFGNCEGNDMFQSCPVLPVLVSIAVIFLLWPGLLVHPSLSFNTNCQAFIVNVVSDCWSEISHFTASLWGC